MRCTRQPSALLRPLRIAGGATGPDQTNETAVMDLGALLPK